MTTTVTAPVRSYLFEVYAGDTLLGKVAATGHRQHIWNETRLIGVSAAGLKRLDDWAKIQSGFDTYIANRRVRLTGWEK